MTEQTTTLCEIYGDGSQLHTSSGGIELIKLNEEVLNRIGLVGEYINRIDDNQNISLGMGLWISRSDMLGRLPKPNYTDKEQSTISLFPILDAFGKFLYTNTREALRGLKPSYVRVLAIGPNATKVNSWHCDPLIESIGGFCISRALPNLGRIVVGVDGRLRKDSRANIQFVSGNFVVRNVVSEREGCKTNEWQSLYEGYPEGSTLVTREQGSIINIADESFLPSNDTVNRFDDLLLTNLGCTSLHAASTSEDSVRFSLQCFYDGLE